MTTSTEQKGARRWVGTPLQVRAHLCWLQGAHPHCLHPGAMPTYPTVTSRFSLQLFPGRMRAECGFAFGMQRSHAALWSEGCASSPLRACASALFAALAVSQRTGEKGKVGTRRHQAQVGLWPTMLMQLWSWGSSKCLATSMAQAATSQTDASHEQPLCLKWCGQCKYLPCSEAVLLGFSGLGCPARPQTCGR